MKKSLIIGIILLIGIVAIAGCTTDAPADEPVTEVAEPVEEVTSGEEQAAKMAERYIRTMPFSRQGLIEQLEFEGFTREEAEYGVDQLDVDWNEQAAKKAQNYLDTMPFSREGLISQLEFEGFTREQAVYGVNAVGL